MGGKVYWPSNRRTCLRVTRKQGQAERNPRRELTTKQSLEHGLAPFHYQADSIFKS